ncbi:hypothetical protein [Actinomycetospora cinnamomea]|uniref:DUF4386 family protein n=1 Tax=Actinomycetospora cinnamomea TaxID=663609 RepID=A0A2U1F6W5_9PSEU|nr:hypothetical protein [Actinomycetospora cinnamomea]PVZ07892.1 hypothetical protein C8D89_11045 [Actinomycetospora cinnamomea]
MRPATPRFAAVLGLVFAALFVAALVTVNGAPHLDAPVADYAAFYDGAGDTVVTAVAIYLVPLAGIAFLWFAVALRSVLDTLGTPPSGLAHGLNLLSGVVFVALLFAGTAAMATPVLLTTIGGGAPLAPDTARALSALGYGLVFLFSVRGAGMFAVTTTTLLRGAGVMPRGVAVAAYALATWLLVTATDHPVSLLVLPAWVLLVAVVLLRHDRRTRAATGPSATDPMPTSTADTARRPARSEP